MLKFICGASALALSAAAAHAGGIERTTQSAMVLFETGNHAEFSLGVVRPDVSGESLFVPAEIDNVAGQFSLPGAALKMDLSDRLAAALIIDRPFGADISYESTNPILGGTTAEASTTAMTALLKYQITDRFSAFGGLRHQKAEGEINLQGGAYGPVSGYNVKLDSGSANGYVLGAAYEIPDIALRVALTYNSAITHSLGTTETGPLVDPDGPGPAPALPLLNGTGTTDVMTPESWHLEFQTGVAENTLLFGSIRHVKHSAFEIEPDQFSLVTGGGLVSLDDTTTYRIGVGRRFNDKFAGSVTLAHEPATGDDLVSPLAPTNGNTGITIGGSYNLSDNVTLSGGVSYVWLGDAKPETGTPDVARAEFEDNTAMGIGFKVAFKF